MAVARQDMIRAKIWLDKDQGPDCKDATPYSSSLMTATYTPYNQHITKEYGRSVCISI